MPKPNAAVVTYKMAVWSFSGGTFHRNKNRIIKFSAAVLKSKILARETFLAAWPLRKLPTAFSSPKTTRHLATCVTPIEHDTQAEVNFPKIKALIKPPFITNKTAKEAALSSFTVLNMSLKSSTLVPSIALSLEGDPGSDSKKYSTELKPCKTKKIGKVLPREIFSVCGDFLKFGGS